MPPAPKKSKLTLKSSALAGPSSSFSKPKKTSKKQEEEDRLSDLEQEIQDEFDLDAASGGESEGSGGMDTDDEIEKANEQGGKSKKTAS